MSDFYNDKWNDEDNINTSFDNNALFDNNTSLNYDIEDEEESFNYTSSDLVNVKDDNDYHYTYNETHIKKSKNKKGYMKIVAVALISAFLGSALTCGLCFGLMPDFIYERIDEDNKYNKYSPYNFEATSKGPVDANTGVSMEQGTLSVVDIAKKVGTSVVGIVTTVPRQTFFGVEKSQGSGSGIIVSPDGYVVTNNHVIEGATTVEVYLSSGEKKSAKLVGYDSKTDLAVIKLENGQYPYAELGNSSELQVGELCVAIGNPLGMEFAGSVTVGYISALNRTVETEGKTFNLIQTDAAINAGNSGGALVNTKGQVIGINTLKISSTGVEGLGFAIPIDEAKPVFEDLLNYGYVKGRPVIGIIGRDISEEVAKYYEYPQGIFVEQTQSGSGAASAGIRRGDIIVKADGVKVKTIEELNKIRDTKKAGSTILLEIDRSGETISVNVVLGEEKTNE